MKVRFYNGQFEIVKEGRVVLRSISLVYVTRMYQMLS